MSTIKTCPGSYIDVGPLEQTLFLGCSVTSFNMSLGWGADSSSMTINIVNDTSYHPASAELTRLTTLATSINSQPATNPSTALEVNPLQETVSTETNSTKYLHRPITQIITEQHNTNDDSGKVYRGLDGQKKYWTGPDPGFLGNNYDIVGSPAYFKFADGIEFGGVIAGWKTSTSQGGRGGYEVEIKSYTSLLAGCQLIIDNYNGSISTIINENIAVPSLTDGDYTGSIKHGNIPNVFNVYGYLESYGFGTAGKTNNGVSALQIYKALIDLTSCNGNTGKYSPYGAIVGKHLVATDGSEVDVANQTITINNASISLEELGLCRNVDAVDSIKRSLFKLDISEVPVPPNDLYISSSYISILDFISRICEGSGYDFYVAFDKDTSGTSSGIITIKTVSRRAQPPKDIIKSIIDSITASANASNLHSASYGQEYNDKETRSMYVGAPQKRLLQVISTNIALTQNSLIFDPYANNGAGSFVSYGTFENYIRIPDHGSTRINQYNSDGGSAVGQINTSSDFNTSDTFGNSLTIRKGNYFASESVTTQDSTVSQNPLLKNTNSYPLYLDLICPYFGNHGSSSSSGSSSFPRKVFLDKKMGQLQVVFNTNDITTIISNSYSSNAEFIVTETELRAAGKSFEAWFTYCFDNFFTTDISDLVYAIFKKSYPAFANKNNFLKGLSVINWSAVAKAPTTQSHDYRASPVTVENAQSYTKFLYSDLQKIHSFFQNIAQEYYGKQYMVRTPKLNWYKDGDLKVAFGNFAYPNSGKIYSDWEISKDGAWEEAGNFIDDTIVVGSTASDFFTSDDGRIQPILGFNACGEIANRDFWVATNISPSTSSMYKLTAASLSQTRSQGVKNDFFYFPLEHDFNVDEYLYIPYTSPSKANGGLGNTDSTLLNMKTSQGESIPDNWVYKMYVKSDVSEDLIFLDNQPRAILSLPSPLFIGGGKSDTDDMLAFNMIHDAICYNERGTTFPQGYNGSRRVNRAVSTFSQLFTWGLTSVFKLYCPDAGVTINSSAENVKIMPKATCPAFAAIPVQFNRATYGPWINHPGLVGNLIFPGYSNVDNFVNNLVGGVKIDVDAGLAPWEYGGMDALDAAVMNRIKDDINYQQITEQGTIQTAGLLKDGSGNSVGLGNALAASANATNGPILSNLSMSIDSGGIIATYNMRTYTKKIGFFNKENADRIKQINIEFLKRKRDLNKSITTSLATLKANGFAGSQNINQGDTPKQLRWSPFEVLAGAAYVHVNEKSSLTDIYSTNSLNFSPYWNKLPYGNVTTSVQDMPRYLTNVSVQDVQELPREIKDDYALKSYMSLDGLLSPISFYPTPYGSTYNITKYPTSGCPFCKGTSTYQWEKFNLPTSFSQVKKFSDLMSIKNLITQDCPFCESNDIKTKKSYISASPKETTPPYVLASGDDLTIISKNNIPSVSGISGNPVINYSTLNPILLTTGEFSCFQNRQSNDSTAHSIDLVGFGLTAPTGDNSLKPSRSSTIEKNFLDYDQNYIDYCTANGRSPPSIKIANNMRFFGLRGPIMVHGWGYDLEGFPVPNASGEPKLKNNQIVRDDEGNIIGKNQVEQPDGTWSKPYKENSFYKGWGQLPGTWPVGPVDLRWDSNAGVWTVGANYKPVWVVIETDLVKGEPSRGEIIDDSYTNDPLPSGLRKLVFVKDSLGINPAPRGAPIYCKYNSQNGFYEPIYHKVFASSGTITGDTTVDIYNLYKNLDQTYSTTYENPLGFEVSYDSLGLFAYMNNTWILQSYKC